MTETITRRELFLFFACLSVSFVAGGLNGLIGVGGGTVFFFVSSLAGIGRENKKDTFSFAMLTTVPLSLVSLLLYGNFSLPPSHAVMLISTSAVGGLVGAFLRGKIKTEHLSYAFSALTVFSGVRMLFG